MMTSYTGIKQFTAIIAGEGKSVVVIGLGDDGWMYEYQGDTGTWNRLSKEFPHTIYLPGSQANNLKSVSTTTMDEEIKVMDPAPEAEEPAAAEESAEEASEEEAA